jgi:hypothetical protein
VFVTHDGKETDLDIGRYERFVDVRLSAAHYAAPARSAGTSSDRSAGAFLGRTSGHPTHGRDQALNAVLESEARSPSSRRNGRRHRNPVPRSHAADGRTPGEDAFFVHLALPTRRRRTRSRETDAAWRKELRGGISLTPSSPGPNSRCPPR